VSFPEADPETRVERSVVASEALNPDVFLVSYTLSLGRGVVGGVVDSDLNHQGPTIGQCARPVWYGQER